LTFKAVLERWVLRADYINMTEKFINAFNADHTVLFNLLADLFRRVSIILN